MKTLVTKSNCSMGLASYFFSSFGGGSGRKDQVIFQRDNNVLGERICFVLTMSASVGARKGLVRVHNLTKEVHMGDMKTRQCNFIFTHMLLLLPFRRTPSSILGHHHVMFFADFLSSWLCRHSIISMTTTTLFTIHHNDYFSSAFMVPSPQTVLMLSGKMLQLFKLCCIIFLLT